MAAVQRQKIKGSAPKVRNRNRGPGYWIGLAKSRDNRERELPKRDPRRGINFPHLNETGSAAYRRMRKH